MKKFILLLIFLSSFASADMMQVPIISLTDNPACNYFFSLIFFMFLIITPSKIAIQIIWDFARKAK
jgi:hypothetical protein